jgi:Tol biopolymer transport system component
MLKSRFLYWSLIITLMVAGCTIEIEQPQMTTPVVQVDTPSVTAVATSSLPTLQIPVTWADLNLTGKLVYISGSDVDESILNIQMLDLVTGTLTTIFTSPPNAWIYYITVSPDNQQLIMSYSPPYQQNVPVYQALYRMPLNGSDPPRFLITPPSVDDKYLHVEWAPDGRYIYFGNYILDKPKVIKYHLCIGEHKWIISLSNKSAI